MTFLYFSMNSKCYDLVKQFIYHFQLNLFYPERMSSSLRKCDILLFSELINIVSILFYKFIEFIIMLYTFLVISFAGYKEYIISLISFSKFSDVLPAFTCVINNLWSICLGVNILRWLVTPRHFFWLGIFLIVNTLSVTLFVFSFSGISLLLTEFLQSINGSLR